MPDDKKNDFKVIENDLIPDIKFNLKTQEQFAKDKGIVFEHWAAIPSVIGEKDIGDYRKPDSLDTISENGFIYKKMGEFVGTILSNSKRNKFVEGGIFDNSVARLMLSKFYLSPNESKEIALLPGDRIYAKNIKLAVPNYQKVEFDPKRSNLLQFPATGVDFLKDSRNIEYAFGNDFKLDQNGDICWIAGRNNPGIDEETGRGRIYGVRYRYDAFWYVHELINEIRITNTSDSSQPQRLPYSVSIQREYVYHNRKRKDNKNEGKSTETNRTVEPPKENIDPNNDQYQVKVDIRNFE